MTIDRMFGPERRDRHRARHVLLHQRPDDVLRQVAHRAQRGHLALEDQVADRDAAGVHAHDHRRQRALGHPRHGPVGHGDHLRHRLTHVGAGEERQLGQGDLLDVPRVDVLDAVHVLEVQLELVDDEPFHLVGAHADVVEEDVDLRHVQRGEDVHPHAVVGQHAAADQGHDHHHGRDRVPHGYHGRIHRPILPVDSWQARHPGFKGNIPSTRVYARALRPEKPRSLMCSV